MTALPTAKYQVGVQEGEPLFFKRLKAFAAMAHIRKIPLKLQQPDLEISQDDLQLSLRFVDSRETGLYHSVKPLVWLVWWRKLDYQVAHVGEAR